MFLNMAVRTKIAFQHVLINPLPCELGHIVHLHLWTSNPSYTGEETKFISICPDQTPRKATRTQHVQHVLTNQTHAREDTTFITTCVDQTHPIPARTQNLSQHVMKKRPPTCVAQTPPMPARTQNASQHVLTKPLQCQRGHKMHLNMCWPNTSHANEETKWASNCVK